MRTNLGVIERMVRLALSAIEGGSPEALIAVTDDVVAVAAVLSRHDAGPFRDLLDLRNHGVGPDGVRCAAAETVVLAHEHEAEGDLLTDALLQHRLVALFEDVQRESLSREKHEVKRKQRYSHTYIQS